jgi:pilus assembly protein CpaC
LIVAIGGTARLSSTSKRKLKAVSTNVEGIVRVTPDAIDERAVIITGVRPGIVRVVLTDEGDKTDTFEIVVQLDVELLKNTLRRAVPTANVEPIPLQNNQVVLTGYVARIEDVDAVQRIAAAAMGGGTAGVINSLVVGGVHQVQLDVTVASVNRSEIRRRGVNFAVNGTTFSMGSILGGLTASTGTQAQNAVAGAVGVVPGAAQLLPNSPPGGANVVFGVIPARFQGLLQALRDENLAKFLAEPKVISLSGRPARFLAGGQAAVLSAQGSIGGPGVDFRDVGTEVEMLPIVLGNGRIYLEVRPRVRVINQGLGITTSFGFVPGFDEQSVQTAIEMEPGQTFAIGGLIQTTTQAASTKVPVIGDLPFVGNAFRTNFHQEQETELVILVTPHLVDAQDCRQAPKRLPGRETRSPDDYEMFVEGILEAPRGQRVVFPKGRYEAPWKNDPTASQLPCAGPLPWGTQMRDGCKDCQKGPHGGNCAPGAAGVPMIANPAGTASVTTEGRPLMPAMPLETLPVPKPALPPAVLPTPPAKIPPVGEGPRNLPLTQAEDPMNEPPLLPTPIAPPIRPVSGGQ